jgi:hypothetical protein
MVGRINVKLIYVFCRNKVLKILAFLCGGKNSELEKTLKQVGKYMVLVLSGQYHLSLTIISLNPYL